MRKQEFQGAVVLVLPPSEWYSPHLAVPMCTGSTPFLERLTVKMPRFTVFALTMLLTASQVHGQETSEEHAAYAQLKVLEPLVGSWKMSGTGDGGNNFEYELTFSWTSNKSMLLGDASLKVLDGGENQLEIPWHRLGYVWNDNTNSIEMTRLALNSGVIEVSSLALAGDGKIRRSQIRSTSKEQVTEDTVITISEGKIAVASTNRKNAAGEALPDETLTLTRLR